MTVAEALALARRLGIDRLDGQLLVGAALGRPRSWLLAHDDAQIPPPDRPALEARLRRRAGGEPLAYLLGTKEFRGLDFNVGPAVLIPRPDTETLVEWALALLAAMPSPADVLDLGTGSGAIALSVKHGRPSARVTALDRSADALAIARGNGERLGLPVDWLHSDWWGAVRGRQFDLLLSNPPYIAAADPHLAALGHEPLEALASGTDGLDALRVIAAGAAAHLRPGGWTVLEHGHEQADAVAGLLLAAGFERTELRHDLAGRPRCTAAKR